MAAPTPDPVTDYLIRHELDPDDVEYLNERLGRLMKVADQLAPLFFEALFKHLPHSKKLFHGDESSQLVMYSSILWSASACLQDPEAAHARLAEIEFFVPSKNNSGQGQFQSIFRQFISGVQEYFLCF